MLNARSRERRQIAMVKKHERLRAGKSAESAGRGRKEKKVADAEEYGMTTLCAVCWQIADATLRFVSLNQV